MISHIGKPIFAALTQREIAELLDILFMVLPPDLNQQVLEQLLPDTRQTLEQILSPSLAADKMNETADKTVSIAKLAETWSTLWDQWDGIVSEAAQEEGDYIAQEEHWEPPYFDEYALVEDLEKVADKMLPLVKIAYENRFDPDMGFGAAISAAEEEISSSLPDWIGIDNGFDLPSNLTRCLLAWERLLADEEGEDVFGFAQRLRQWEDEFAYSQLDRNSVVEFFAELSEADERCVLRGLTANREDALWKGPLGSTYSHWHGLYMYYLDRYAPERFLDNLRADIPQQWRAGLPVLEDLLKHKKYGQCVAVAHEMVESMLRIGGRSQNWTPETDLLFNLVYGHYDSQRNWKDHEALLRNYQRAAQGLKQAELDNTLSIQLAAFDHSFDWERMFAILGEAGCRSQTQDALFRSWRNQIVQASKPEDHEYSYGYREKKNTDSWWLQWLLDRFCDSEKGISWFQDMTDEWLLSLSAIQATPDENHGVLRLLTSDLAAIGQIDANPFPRFFQYVVRPRQLSTNDETSRRTYLAQAIPANLGNRLMTYWRQHLQELVPDPTSADKSVYSSHAQWMAALQEVNPGAYQVLLREWRAVHHRRRNLWKAMDELQLQ